MTKFWLWCDRLSRRYQKNLHILNHLPRKVEKAHDTQIFKHINLPIDENIFDVRIKEFTDADKSCTIDPNRSTPKQHTVNIIVRKDKLKSDLTNFYHASMFSPVRSTLLKAIENNHLITFPGLTKT